MGKSSSNMVDDLGVAWGTPILGNLHKSLVPENTVAQATMPIIKGISSGSARRVGAFLEQIRELGLDLKVSNF